MKSYLQRLVQTVTNPVESVHPWTGSMFAGGHQGDLNVVQTEELTAATAAKQLADAMSRTSEKSSQASAPTKASESGAERNSLQPELRRTQIAPGSELRTHRASSVSERIILEPLITNTEGSASDSRDATALEITPAQGLETVFPPPGRRSVIGAEAVIKPGNTRQLAVGSTRTPTEQKDARAVRNSDLADRRTDEIQIHIGRIEVTAVHPPPATAPNKEISLDAYLKRRDGRAG